MSTRLSGVQEVEADASEDVTYKLPTTRFPEPIMKGMRGWRTSEGYLVIRCHYTCDPERADQDWVDQTSQGYPGGVDGAAWQREMEIDFGSYAGLPVYPKFDKTNSIKIVRYNRNLPLWRGWDFGYRNPAVVFMQLWPDDTLVILHELFPTIDKERMPGISTADLAKVVLSETERFFPEASDPELSAGVYDFCDPAGVQTKETSDYSSVEILNQHGIHPEHNVVGRKSRIDFARVYVEGKHGDTGGIPGPPRFIINPHCALAIEAFAAAYRYPDDSSGRADREMPDVESRKIQGEPYIHIMDAFEYVVACNLEITYQTKTGFNVAKEDDSKIMDLATAYLGASMTRDDRTVVNPKKDKDKLDLEEDLSDYLGRDNLIDAFTLT